MAPRRLPLRRCACSGLHRCGAGRGLEAPPLVRKSPRLAGVAVAVCWPPAPPWSRSRACVSVVVLGPPAAGGVPALASASPPRWGALCGGCRGLAGRRSAGGGGVYLPPAPAWWPLLLIHSCGSRQPGWGVPPPAGGGWMWYAAKRHTTRYGGGLPRKRLACSATGGAAPLSPRVESNACKKPASAGVCAAQRQYFKLRGNLKYEAL